MVSRTSISRLIVFLTCRHNSKHSQPSAVLFCILGTKIFLEDTHTLCVFDFKLTHLSQLWLLSVLFSIFQFFFLSLFTSNESCHAGSNLLLTRVAKLVPILLLRELPSLFKDPLVAKWFPLLGFYPATRKV